MIKYLVNSDEIYLRLMFPEPLKNEEILNDYLIGFSLASDLAGKAHGRHSIPTKELFDYVINHEFPDLKTSHSYIHTGCEEGCGVIITFD